MLPIQSLSASKSTSFLKNLTKIKLIPKPQSVKFAFKNSKLEGLFPTGMHIELWLKAQPKTSRALADLILHAKAIP
jgi:hypothetical protein